jgi:DNA-binding IclR family transcriptional regulator
LFDHPLASLLQVPRPLEELAELAGLPLRDTRRMLVELEEDGDVLHADDGTWIAASIAS